MRFRDRIPGSLAAGPPPPPIVFVTLTEALYAGLIRPVPVKP